MTSLFRLLRAFVLVVVLASLSVAVSPAWAQDDESHGPTPDTWALQFALNPNLDVGSFSGSVLSVQRQFSAARALRLGVSLDGRFESFDAESSASNAEQDRDVQSIRVQTAYLAYLGGDNDIHAYAGAGPFVRYLNSDRSDDASTQEQETFAVGALGVVGVEWFVRSNLSLLAEYAADVEYAQTTSTNSNDGPAPDSEVEETRFSFGGRGTTVGISVYF